MALFFIAFVKVGDAGGWIQAEENLSHSGKAWVDGKARVTGDNWETSPLYIKGSAHVVAVVSSTQIAVGCHRHDTAWWLDNYESVGRREGYTEGQIEEYGMLLSVAADWQYKMFAAWPKGWNE
jgi:hypothetical protein